MKIKNTLWNYGPQALFVIGVSAMAAALLLAIMTGCASHASAPVAPCTTPAQLQVMTSRLSADVIHSDNSDPIPAGARWPQRSADLAAAGIADDGSNTGTIASLYWDREVIDTEAAIRAMPAMCGQS